MKFLTEEGKIEEGTPLTDDQINQRERLISYFHDQACGNSYHGTYGEKKCEILANAYVTGDIAKVASAPVEPAPIPEPETVMPASKPAEDDYPF